MRTEVMDLLDQAGADTGTDVSGRLTVAQRPAAWEVPEYLDPGTLPSHTFKCRAGSGLAPLKKLADSDGRRYQILGRAETTVFPATSEFWMLKVL